MEIDQSKEPTLPHLNVLRIALIVVERAALFFLVFQKNYQSRLDLAFQFLILSNGFLTAFFPRQLLHKRRRLFHTERLVFYIERYGILLAALCYKFVYKMCWSLAAKVVGFTTMILVVGGLVFIYERVEEEMLRHNEKAKAELEDKEKFQEDYEHHEEQEADDDDVDTDEGGEDGVGVSDDEDEEFFAAAKRFAKLLSEYKGRCLNLEAERKDLTAKLAAASASLEQYHRIEKHYVEDRNKWEIEKKELSAKPDAANTSAPSLADYYTLDALAQSYLIMYHYAVNDLAVTNSWYEYYAQAAHEYQQNNQNLLEEINDLSAQLHSANSLTEFYQAYIDDRLFAENSWAEYCYRLDEKCRKLEEEKNDLAAELCATKAASELYRSSLQDCNF